MFADCFSLADSQYFILLLLLTVQLFMYRRNYLFPYSIAFTIVLLAIYPIFFDTLPREIFSLLFSLILLIYTVQLVYISLSEREIVPIAVVVGVYTILFFVISTLVNTALLFTKPVDALVGLYDRGEKVARMASLTVQKARE